MTIGTILMIICLVLLVLLSFFKKDTDEVGQKYSVYNDPDFEGLDGCGVLGHSVDDLNKDLYGEK